MDWTSAVHSDEHLDGRAYIGVVVKRAYRIVARRLERLAIAPPLHREIVARPLPEGDALLEADSDLNCFDKPVTDVVLRGSAHAPQRVTVLDTGLRVGPVMRQVRIHGQRHLKVTNGALSTTKPMSFQTMPLGWDRAYGGRDRDAEQRLGFDADGPRCAIETLDPRQADRLGAISDPRNRHGRGFRIDLDRARLHGIPLATQSDPKDPCDVARILATSPLDWATRPTPACYGPIDLLTLPRLVHAGIWPSTGESEHETTPPDVRMANSAAPGLAVCRLKGNERISLHHLHRAASLLEFDLPRERPRLLLEPPNTRRFELAAKLDTVLIEPDEDRVTLTWTGAMEAGAVFPQALCEEMRHAAIWQ